ncbi:MAG: Hsp20/alpha crystallin family protein [Sulfurimonas sp.]|nr:Hsp20/alpha crystallin family protein [Sulfurimonas sp.]MBU1217933.1 Hsp20/alpha crystallin family protein [bacterium]MBU1434133.1 Hsp20/alpha crystallin family protein [bacterium]MBU1503114.1 Hsp20/alpha crystallin family protein [bacterium]MBU3938863.1 Hsp20/alpha crystallin family protein [bacterium]
MKTLTKALLAFSLTGVLLNASDVALTQTAENEFDRMQKFMNSFMSSNFKHEYFNSVYPKINMQDQNNTYVLTFDVSGMSKDEIKLSIEEGNILTIEGQRHSDTKTEEENYMKREMFHGAFKRSVVLPEDANHDKLTTKYTDGILKVMIGKKAVVKPVSKVIPIN